MSIDDIKLFEAMKKLRPSEPTDTEKIEAANELHEWLKPDAEKSSR